jgi:hypothetical protein
MARYELKVGGHIDLLTPGELETALDKQTKALTAYAIGLKHLRLPTIQGTPANSALVMGGQGCGPRDGFIWSIRRLIINGLTTGTTPDVVNFYLNAAQGIPMWQLNGNQFGQTFGRLEFTMYGGDQLFVASVGTFNATGTISIAGELLECPAEMISKLM